MAPDSSEPDVSARGDRAAGGGKSLDSLHQDETVGAEPSEVDSNDKIPDRVGRYRMAGRIGFGGFGTVYKAYDQELQREVAIKIPHRQRMGTQQDIEAFMGEARTLAGLDHPGIVPIYDVARMDDGRCYLVSKIIEGSNLNEWMRSGHPSHIQIAGMIASVAEALHHAHQRGLVHRDVKPGNILVDSQERVYVADFGLALHDNEMPASPKLAGTPAYMSPEQAGGEAHRIDARSDVYSLGVVMYELLTASRPFEAKTAAELLQRIVAEEPRPPRQLDDRIPRELDRICLKAIARRAAERYSTAADLAEDLRNWLAGPVSSATTSVKDQSISSAPPGIAQNPSAAFVPAASMGAASISSGSGAEVVSPPVVPKGLRSFDQDDADFFLQLLPGPRDRDGLPESVRFWKMSIDQTDPEKTFTVGLIYGPSGCGKSSMVKAGLLPRLASHVTAIYVEATGDSTEVRLINAIRRRFPGLPPNLALAELLAAVRRSTGLAAREKLLVVIDQFEQWLHTHRDDEQPDLAEALRQCDGARVQAIVMVRDDFWMAVTRFMRSLEVPLVEGQNSAAVDLFGLRHARNVLIGFGRSLRCLPESGQELSSEQGSFIEKSVAELAEEGKVIPVRLALFADMLKKRPWTPQTLRSLGGTQGIGATFFEDTFCGPSAPPEHRLHQRAARAVLKSLMFLPGEAADIKGRIRSKEQMLEASGYRRTPAEFDDLMRVLDSELRIVTPTDPEGADPQADAVRTTGQYYQLTHDFLVPALREWLTRKQRETSRGRAQLRLEERALHWTVKPEPALLPGWWEWVSIRLRTAKREWTPDQKRMMRSAGRRQAVHASMVLALILAIGLGIVEVRGRIKARTLRDEVAYVDRAQIPQLVARMKPYRRWVDPLLRDLVAVAPEGSPAKLKAAVVLVASDESPTEYLAEQLFRLGPDDAAMVQDALAPRRARIVDRLWSALEDRTAPDARRVRAAITLAHYVPSGDPEAQGLGGRRWINSADYLAQRLVSTAINDTAHYDELRLGLAPAGTELLDVLGKIYHDPLRGDSERSIAMNIASEYAGDNPNVQSDVLVTAWDASRLSGKVTLLEARRKEAIGFLKGLMSQDPETQRRAGWNDKPIESAAQISPETQGRFPTALGMIEDRFAFCQTMPLAECAAAAEELRAAGYRPVRFRPFNAGAEVRVAAVWTRDGGEWKLAHGLTAKEAQEQYLQWNQQGLSIADLGAYLVGEDFRYSLLAMKDPEAIECRFDFGISDAAMRSIIAARQDSKDKKEKDFWPVSTVVTRGLDGTYCYTVSWLRRKTPWTASVHQYIAQPAAALYSGLPLHDLSVMGAADTPRIVHRRLKAMEEAAKPALPDPGNILNRATLLQTLGDFKSSLDLLSTLPATPPNSLALRLMAMAQARLGQAKEAHDSLAAYAKVETDDDARVQMKAVVAAWLGEDVTEAVHQIEAVKSRHSEQPGALYALASVYARLSGAAANRDKSVAADYANRSVALLEQAYTAGLPVTITYTDSNWDAIRALPGFVKICRRDEADRVYVALWRADPRTDVQALHGMNAETHLAASRKLAAAGYRPVSISVAQLNDVGELAAASVWKRPAANAALDDLARRKANAAALLARLGDTDSAWPLFRQAEDSGPRSQLIHAWPAMGGDPELLVTRLEMEKDASVRQALVQSLGEYGVGRLPSSLKASLGARLLELYRNDPDPGVHASARWVLQSWNPPGYFDSIDHQLPLAEPATRRWYVTREGQAMTVIDKPVPFMIGSPANETGKGYYEHYYRTQVPAGFAIASTPVTVGQFRRFVADHPEFNSAATAVNGDPSLPVTNISWLDAVRYCRWLSEQDGLPEQQMCFDPVNQIRDAVTYRDSFLLRSGYRLPTEVEWEYACRAGTTTAFSFGNSTRLLPHYGWSEGDPKALPRPVGLLKPNDWGLFDMHGNVSNWCQNEHIETWQQSTRLDGKPDVVSEPLGIEAVQSSMSLRGGSVWGAPDQLRSANRSGALAGTASPIRGFRVARTLPQFSVIAADRIEGSRVELIVNGPPAPFVVRTIRGDVTVTPSSGTLPAVVTVSASGGDYMPYALEIERTDTRQIEKASGALSPPLNWQVSFYATIPDKSVMVKENWEAALASEPIGRVTTPRIRFQWGKRGPLPDRDVENFATVATTRIRLAEGKYTIACLADDGIRVFIDAETMIDEWANRPPTLFKKSASLKAGDHDIRIEHFNGAGPASLTFEIRLEP